jgi:arylsulfatase
VSTGISRGFKGQVSEGGILSPAIVHYPKSNIKNVRYDHFLSVMDIFPTVLDLANETHPGTSYMGREVHPLKGASFAPVILGEESSVHPDGYVMGWELFGGKALRQGKWKLVSVPGSGDGAEWKLYNLDLDPGEQKDLSEMNRERVETMISLWEAYVVENGVILNGVNEKIMIQPE